MLFNGREECDDSRAGIEIDIYAVDRRIEIPIIIIAIKLNRIGTARLGRAQERDNDIPVRTDDAFRAKHIPEISTTGLAHRDPDARWRDRDRLDGDALS